MGWDNVDTLVGLSAVIERDWEGLISGNYPHGWLIQEDGVENVVGSKLSGNWLKLNNFIWENNGLHGSFYRILFIVTVVMDNNWLRRYNSIKYIIFLYTLITYYYIISHYTLIIILYYISLHTDNYNIMFPYNTYYFKKYSVQNVNIDIKYPIIRMIARYSDIKYWIDSWSAKGWL